MCRPPCIGASRLALPTRIIMKRLCICICVLLICARGEAQTLTSVGASSVAPANDFATTAFQDPWDMNERTDLGWFLNGVDQPGSAFSSVSFANGVFSGINAGSGNVFLLESGNPNAAGVGKIGRNYPDRCEHPRLAFRVSTSTASSTFLQWNRGHHLRQHHDSQQHHHDRFPDFASTWPIAHAGHHSYWDGCAFRLGRHGQVAVDVLHRAGTVSVDWARLSRVQPSLCRTITWSSGRTHG